MQPVGDIVMKELAIMPLNYELDPLVLLFEAPFSRLTASAIGSVLKTALHRSCYNDQRDLHLLIYQKY